MTATETLAELVRIDSVSSRPNAEILSCLIDRCAAMGLAVRTLPYVDDAGDQKLNMIASSIESASPPAVELALVGHTDTVPFDPAWQDATNLIERDGNLYGRGACD